MTFTCGATASHLCVRNFPAKVNAVAFLPLLLYFFLSFISCTGFLTFNYRIIWGRKYERNFCWRTLTTVITLNFAGERMKRN